jgi:hypothetical protein
VRSVFRARKLLAERGGKVVIANAQPQVQKVFDIVKAVPLSEIFRTVEKRTPTWTDPEEDHRRRRGLTTDCLLGRQGLPRCTLTACTPGRLRSRPGRAASMRRPRRR